jgi:hypothetical protein
VCDYSSHVRWCARCGAAIDDGLLLCTDCTPRDKLQQDVLIKMGSPPTSTVKARDILPQGGKKKSRLRAVEKVEWNGDRRRLERRVMLFDHRDRVYCETWFHLKTGEITWGPKRGSLDDQTIHGGNAQKRRTRHHPDT